MTTPPPPSTRFPFDRQQAGGRLACVCPTLRAVVAAAREPYRVHQPALHDAPLRPPQKFHATLGPGAVSYGYRWSDWLRILPPGASILFFPGSYPPLSSADLTRSVSIFGSGPTTSIGSSSYSIGVHLGPAAPAVQLFLAELTVVGSNALKVEGGSLRVQARGKGKWTEEGT